MAARHRFGVLRIVHGTVVGTIAAFLVAPVLLTLALSFSGDAFFRFPPSEWGLQQYRTLIESPIWLPSLRLSVLVAIPSACLALTIGIAASFGLIRSSLPGREIIQLAGLSPMIIPITALAVALYGFYARIGLLGSRTGLVLSHAVLGVPFVLLITGSALQQIPRELELVAMSLGASRVRAMIGITGRLLLPAAIASFIFAFLTSFDEATLVTFLGGPGLITLPKAIFDSTRFSIDPVITAIASILIISTASLIAAGFALRRGETR